MSSSQLPGYVTPKKRRKTSGLTGLELRMALTALQSVKASLKEISTMIDPEADDDPQSQDDLISFGSDFEQLLDRMLEMMQSKIDGPQVSMLRSFSPFSSSSIPLANFLQALSFSGIKFEHLDLLNLEDGGSIQLKKDYETRAAATDLLGTAEHWSSEGLYRHLTVLQDLVPKAVSAHKFEDGVVSLF
jgi:hypothetical protein